MKINFVDRLTNNDFEVRIDVDIPKEIKESVLQNFRKNTNKLDEYIKTKNEIKNLVHKNKELLLIIKKEFEIYSEKNYPELKL